MEYTTIKVPLPVHESLKRLQAEITKKGIQNLSPEVKNIIEDKICPFCYQQMESIEVSWYKCPKCGYQKQSIDIYQATAADVLALIALGALIGLGIAALIQLLKK